MTSETTILAVELFNASVPIGSEVVYIEDDGTRIDAVTRSEAWVLPSGTAVFQMKGRSGCFALGRVRIPLELVVSAKSEASNQP